MRRGSEREQNRKEKEIKLLKNYLNGLISWKTSTHDNDCIRGGNSGKVYEGIDLLSFLKGRSS